jgi:hypothetical protein
VVSQSKLDSSSHLIFPLDRLSKNWVSPIYAFFQPTPSAITVDGCRIHEFKCTATHCKGRGRNARLIRRYLDTSDRNSTGSLRKHAWLCWGEEVLQGADACGDVNSTRQALSKAKILKNGSITTAFERKGKGQLTFSHRQHEKPQTRFVVFENHLVMNLIYYLLGSKLLDGLRKAYALSISSMIEVFSAL